MALPAVNKLPNQAQRNLTLLQTPVREKQLASSVGDGNHVKRIAKITYDVATDGGAQRQINLGVLLPVNSILLKSFYEVVTTFTSATDAATISIDAEQTEDILDAIAISDGSNPFDAGFHEGDQIGSAATVLRLVPASQVAVTVAVEDLTAGKMIIYIEYIQA